MDENTVSHIPYMFFLNKEQISRIMNIQNSKDYLLKQRADIMLDKVRIYRVIKKRQYYSKDWDFEEHFEKTPFDNYLKLLDFEDFDKINKITYGYIFCDDANGRITKTDYGNIVTISESLKYFLYFMNLCFLTFDGIEIPNDVRHSALIIAIRTMLQSESLDFELDPRGIIPDELEKQLVEYTNLQIEFIVGHEFSHHLLNHLDNASIIEKSMFERECNIYEKIYTYGQQQEFEADIDAIKRPIMSDEMRKNLVNRALFFFAYLDIYDNVKEQIFPSNKVKSHPDPRDRFNKIKQEFHELFDKDELDNLDNLLNLVDFYKEELQEDVSVNIERYEFYGSLYLGSWRGKPLVDRVDY